MQDFLHEQRAAEAGRIQRFAETLWPLFAKQGSDLTVEEAERLIQKSYSESKNRHDYSRIQNEMAKENASVQNVLYGKAGTDKTLTLQGVKEVIAGFYERQRVSPRKIPGTIKMPVPQTEVFVPANKKNFGDVGPVDGDYADYYKRMK